MLFIDCIAPHLLEPVKSPRFGQHDMNDNINVVYDDPLEGLYAFVPIGTFRTFIFYFHLNKISNGFDLRMAAGLTYYKEVCNSFMNFPKVK